MVCVSDLGVRISLYCSFSTLVVAATDMGMTMLLMSKGLSPLLRRMVWKVHKHTQLVKVSQCSCSSNAKVKGWIMKECTYWYICYKSLRTNLGFRISIKLVLKHNDKKQKVVKSFLLQHCCRDGGVWSSPRSTAVWSGGCGWVYSEQREKDWGFPSPCTTWEHLDWKRKRNSDASLYLEEPVTHNERNEGQRTLHTLQRGLTGSLAAVAPVERTALTEMLPRVKFTGARWDIWLLSGYLLWAHLKMWQTWNDRHFVLSTCSCLAVLHAENLKRLYKYRLLSYQQNIKR